MLGIEAIGIAAIFVVTITSGCRAGMEERSDFRTGRGSTAEPNEIKGGEDSDSENLNANTPFDGADTTKTNDDPVYDASMLDSLPGISTTLSLGIHFEDGSDGDYNDAMICFDGKFKFDAETGMVVALENRSTNAVISRSSPNTINMIGSITNPDGLSEQIFNETPLFGVVETVEINWKIGSNLWLDYTVALSKYNITDKARVRFEADICRTTGI